MRHVVSRAYVDFFKIFLKSNTTLFGFRFFSVNPKNSSSSKSYSNSLQTSEEDSKTVHVKLMLECVVILASRTHESHALVLKVKAPPPPPPLQSNVVLSLRAPLDLVTLLDVGGNMTSPKVDMLKCVMCLV